MKQHITIKQLNELIKKQKLALADHYKDEPHDTTKFSLQTETEISLPFLSIGQMIEFLGDDFIYLLNDKDFAGTGIRMQCVNVYNKRGSKQHKSSEFCDSLWEAMKEAL